MTKVSRGESLLRMVLRRVLPYNRHLYNVRNLGIINPETNQELEIDIYVPALKLGFEFNGMQHHAEGQKNRDNIKKKICKQKGITLITIWTYSLLKDDFCKWLADSYPEIPFKKPKRSFVADFREACVQYVNSIKKMNKKLNGSREFRVLKKVNR